MTYHVHDLLPRHERLDNVTLGVGLSTRPDVLVIPTLVVRGEEQLRVAVFPLWGDTTAPGRISEAERAALHHPIFVLLRSAEDGSVALELVEADEVGSLEAVAAAGAYVQRVYGWNANARIRVLIGDTRLHFDVEPVDAGVVAVTPLVAA